MLMYSMPSRPNVMGDAFGVRGARFENVVHIDEFRAVPCPPRENRLASVPTGRLVVCEIYPLVLIEMGVQGDVHQPLKPSRSTGLDLWDSGNG